MEKHTGFMEACAALQSGECREIINDQGVHYTIQWGIISAVESIGYKDRDGVLCALTYRHGEGIKAPPQTFLGEWVQVKDKI